MSSLNPKGYTLIEMSMVIFITAIILVSGVSYVSIITPRRLEAETRKMIAELCWVRELAVSRHQNYTLTFDTAANSYIIYNESGGEIKRDNLTIDLISVTDSSGSPASQATFYYPKGTAQDRIINLGYGGRSQRVRLFPETGYARME